MSDDLTIHVRAAVNAILPELVRAAVREELRALLASTVPPSTADEEHVAAFLRTLTPGREYAAATLHAAFQAWARAEGHPEVTVRAFGLRAMASGLVSRHDRAHGRAYVVRGR
jgi:hypothetical protein